MNLVIPLDNTIIKAEAIANASADISLTLVNSKARRIQDSDQIKGAYKYAVQKTKYTQNTLVWPLLPKAMGSDFYNVLRYIPATNRFTFSREKA